MSCIDARKITWIFLLTGTLFMLPGGKAEAQYWNAYYAGVRPVVYSTVAYRAGYYGGTYGYYNAYYPGPFARVANRVRARRAARAYYRNAYACCYGVSSYYTRCCDPCGYVAAYPSCYTPCCNPCCTSDPCCYGGEYATASCCAPASDSGTQLTPAPADNPAPADAPAAAPTPATPPPATGEAADNSARIEVTLPAEARVYVNNRLTKSTGSRRQYLSAGLNPGGIYAYHIRVEYRHQGKEMVEQRTVRMRAGQQIALEFPNTELAKTKASTTRLASLQ